MRLNYASSRMLLFLIKMTLYVHFEPCLPQFVQRSYNPPWSKEICLWIVCRPCRAQKRLFWSVYRICVVLSVAYHWATSKHKWKQRLSVRNLPCARSLIKTYHRSSESPGQRSICRKIVVYVVNSSTSRAIGACPVASIIERFEWHALDRNAKCCTFVLLRTLPISICGILFDLTLAESQTLVKVRSVTRVSSSDPTRVKSNYIPHILRFYGKSNAAQLSNVEPLLAASQSFLGWYHQPPGPHHHSIWGYILARHSGQCLPPWCKGTWCHIYQMSQHGAIFIKDVPGVVSVVSGNSNHHVVVSKSIYWSLGGIYALWWYLSNSVLC